MSKAWIIIIALWAAVLGVVLGFITYDTPMAPPVSESPPFYPYTEDTAHYMTREGEIIYVNH